MAGLIRFIPYPVVGGFLAGTGWLLVQGAFGVVAHLPLDFGNLSALCAAPALRQWVLDFLFVDGIDSSAVLNFRKIEQLAERTRVRIAYANAGARIRDVMAQGGVVEADDRVRFFPELELALEWCEDRLLRDAPEVVGRPVSFDAPFAQIVPARSSGSALADYVERNPVICTAAFLYLSSRGGQRRGDPVRCHPGQHAQVARCWIAALRSR